MAYVVDVYLSDLHGAQNVEGAVEELAAPDADANASPSGPSAH